MKFAIPRQDLDRAIQRVLGVVSPKTTLPVLANFLLEADKKGKSISLRATDLDMTVSTVVDATVEEGGGITLPAKRFAEIVRELGEADVTVVVSAEEITIRSGKSNFKIVGIPMEEFPSLPKSDAAGKFAIDGDTLVDMVDKVSFSVSKDETRAALNGALWEFTASDMGMIATDGHRLAVMRIAGKYKDLAGKKLIVPPKAFTHVVRIIGAESDPDVGVAVQENHVTFFIGRTTIDSRLIEGPFPAYDKVIPKDNDKELVVGREELARAVRRVAILSDSLTHQVRVKIAKSKIVLSVSTPDVGEATEELPASFTGDPMEIGYNAHYLLEILKHMGGDEVKFLLSSAVGAAVITTAEDGKDEDYSCLLMPLRLSG